jgi:hypothetical protein
VHAKNGGVPSPAVELGGKTRTVRDCGGEEPAVVVGAEKEKRARCLGMFQFKRPLYVVVRCETYMRAMRSAFCGIPCGGVLCDDGWGTLKFPGTRISSSYGPDDRTLCQIHCCSRVGEEK